MAIILKICSLFLVGGLITANANAQDQLEEVRQAELRRNYNACISGHVTCNKSLLSPTQTEEARQAELRRNYNACISGYVTCNKSLVGR